MINFSLLVKSTSAGVLQLDEHMQVRFANPSALQMVRHDPRHLFTLHLHDLLDKDSACLADAIQRLLRTRVHWSGDVALRRKNRPSLPARLIIDRYSDRGVPYYVCVLSDISQHKQRELALTQLCSIDTLTGLSNRTGFMRALKAALARLRHGPNQLALFFLDVDDLKKINDCWGHAAGDRCLQEIAKRIHATVRRWGSTAESTTVGSEACAENLVARIGGDEFVVLLCIPGTKAALNLAHHISSALNRPWRIQGRKLKLGVTIGIAYAPNHAVTSHELIRCADQAMYYAKNQVKGTVCEFFHHLVMDKTAIDPETDID